MNDQNGAVPLKMDVLCCGWRPLPQRKSSLVGRADYLLDGWIVVHDCTVHQYPGSDRFWVGPPGAPMIDRDRRALIDERTNKARYAQLISFKSKDIGDRWSELALRALCVAFPRALDDPDGAP